MRNDNTPNIFEQTCPKKSDFLKKIFGRRLKISGEYCRKKRTLFATAAVAVGARIGRDWYAAFFKCLGISFPQCVYFYYRSNFAAIKSGARFFYPRVNSGQFNVSQNFQRIKTTKHLQKYVRAKELWKIEGSNTASESY